MDSTALVAQNESEILERVLVGGDLSKLTSQQRLYYYKRVCDSLGLNPLTRPFDYITLQGKLVLYAKRDATDQLRKKHGVSITGLEESTHEGIYIVKATAKDKTGRTDVATGAVPISAMKGVELANNMLRCETKAKRRVTLSIVGLGWLDETEVEAAGATTPEGIVPETGEIADAFPPVADSFPPTAPTPSVAPAQPAEPPKPKDRLDNLIVGGQVMLTQARALSRGSFRARLEDLTQEQRDELADEIMGRLQSDKG